jgi:hypothetical protein
MHKPTIKTLHGPNGLRIKLDSAEIWPSDPGNGTPAMVYLFGYSATYWCAADTGELTNESYSHGDGYRDLNRAQLAWLQSPAIEEEVNTFVETMAHPDR